MKLNQTQVSVNIKRSRCKQVKVGGGRKRRNQEEKLKEIEASGEEKEALQRKQDVNV